jgi:hypothetical protein
VLRRFTIILLVVLVAQLGIAYSLLNLSAAGARVVMVAYSPITALLVPAAAAAFGGSDGALGYVLLLAPALGALVYSALIGLGAAFIWKVRHDTPKQNM